MALIDDDGRLFGVVNIIDALVVLLVLAVVVAGFALVFSQGPEEPDLTTSYATLDLGTQPQYIVAAINEGDTHSPAKQSTLTITDVYVTPEGNQNRVTVRVELEGVAKGGSLQYNDAPPRLGRTLSIVTDRYEVSGDIRAVGDASTLDRRTASVILEDTLDTRTAQAIAPGDEIRVAGRTVATVEDRTVFPTARASQQNVYLNLSLMAYSQFGELRFGDTPLREGQQLTLPGDGYTIDGQIRRVEEPLRMASTQLLVEMAADTDTLRKISEGDAIRAAGDRVGTVESVLAYPTGDVTRNVALLNLSLTAYSRYDDWHFGDTPLREGQQLTIPTDEYVIDGQVRRVETPLQTASTPLLLSTTTDTATAQDIATGDVIRAGGSRVGTIESVTRYGTNDPDRKRVFVGLTALTHQFGDREFFGRTVLTEGASIPLRTSEYTLSSTVERIGASSPRGTQTTKTVTLRMTDVAEPMADALGEGMVERSGTQTIAEVTDVEVTPSVVLIRGQEGQLGVYDHPVDRDVTLTTELTVRETVAGTQFKGETIQQGSTVTLDLGSVTVRATVINIS